jgi:hypothetical protein
LPNAEEPAEDPPNGFRPIGKVRGTAGGRNWPHGGGARQDKDNPNAAAKDQGGQQEQNAFLHYLPFMNGEVSRFTPGSPFAYPFLGAGCGRLTPRDDFFIDRMDCGVCELVYRHKSPPFCILLFKTTLLFTEVFAMRTSALLTMFLTLILLIAGCTGEAPTKKDKSDRATNSGQKSAPAKPSKPSEGS